MKVKIDYSKRVQPQAKALKKPTSVEVASAIGESKAEEKEKIAKSIRHLEGLITDESMNYPKGMYLPLAHTQFCQKLIGSFFDNNINVRSKEFEYIRTIFNNIPADVNFAPDYNVDKDTDPFTQTLNRINQMIDTDMKNAKFASQLITFLQLFLTDDGHNAKLKGYRKLIISFLIALEWSKHKQVYRFDNDFLTELIETDNIVFRKDMFDYLPYNTFYLDVQNINEAQKTGVDGVFVDVIKLNHQYEIRMSCVNQSGQGFHNIIIENEDCVIENEYKTGQEADKLLHQLMAFLNEKPPIHSDKEAGFESFDSRFWSVVVMQTLTYLCSHEPDIAESNETKSTYRKPKPDDTSKPKNKFSEIQKWEVGVRFGNSIRSWRKEHNSYSKTESKSTGRKNKPHYRRGHWHYYWYKTEDGNKIKKPKWLSSVFVNQNLSDDVDIVIHNN